MTRPKLLETISQEASIAGSRLVTTISVSSHNSTTIVLDSNITIGEDIKDSLINFSAPCNSSGITTIRFNNKNYALVDVAGNAISTISDAFCSGHLLTVNLDHTHLKAYIQNSAVALKAISDEDGRNIKETLDNRYTKSETDTLLGAKADTSALSSKANASTLTNYLLKNQGSENANKILRISNTGIITPIELPSSIAVGMIIPFASNGNIPSGFLLCNGASVSKSTYSELFSAIGYTYGGSGDNFNLPNLTDRFIEGSEESGSYIEAGLPNITGTMPGRNGGTYSGALYSITSTSNAFSGTATNTMTGFDASRSSDVYGNSDTVQPASLCLRYIIRAFAGASSDTNDVAITEVLNGLARVTNTIASYGDVNDTIVDSYKDGGTWYRLYKSGWVEQGTVLIAESTNRSVGGLVTWAVPFDDTTYTQVITSERDSGDNYCMSLGSCNKTTENMTVYAYGVNNTDSSKYIHCVAYGMSRPSDAPTYTLTITRHETSYQTITTKVNNVIYMNEQTLTLHSGDIVKVTTGGRWDYPGSVVVNGVSTDTTTYTFTVSGDVAITTTEPYDDEVIEN